MRIVVIGLNHHTSPVTVREKFAFADAAIAPALQALKDRGIVDEAVILSTCNRVEIYAATSRPTEAALRDLQSFLIEHHHYTDALNGEIFAYSEPRSLEHLFQVACGLDSMVLGETEILGQLKKSYEVALQRQQTGVLLN